MHNLEKFHIILKQSLREAEKAALKEEIPVGCVILKDGKIIARGHNLRESKIDPTAHAEIIAIRKAAKYLGDWRLNKCELYVTLEPCPLCAWAIIQARIPKVIFGATDPVYRSRKLLKKHKVEVIPGILEPACRGILQDFFKKRRTRIRS